MRGRDTFQPFCLRAAWSGRLQRAVALTSKFSVISVALPLLAAATGRGAIQPHRATAQGVMLTRRGFETEAQNSQLKTSQGQFNGCNSMLGGSRGRTPGGCERQLFGEERQHVLLDPLADPVRVVAFVLLVGVRDAESSERLLQLLVRREQPVFRADVDRNRPIALQARNVLIEHRERRI